MSSLAIFHDVSGTSPIRGAIKPKSKDLGFFIFMATWARTLSDISLTGHCLLRKLTVNLPLGGSHIIPFR